MRMAFILLRTFVLLSAIASNSNAQSFRRVSWVYEWSQTTAGEGFLRLTALLAPGWHIYSQHMDEGGPLPTRIKINPGDDYSLIGTAVEKGNVFTFYDSLYEMNITWYEVEVSFLQRMSLSRMPAEIRGKIQYMVCNNTQCIPQEHPFTLQVDAKN